MKLLDVADIHRGDGRWVSGLSVEGLQCSLTSRLGAVCLPSSVSLLGGTGGVGKPTGYPISVFGIIAQLAQPQFCATNDPEAAVRDAVESEADKAFGRALWFGTGDASMWLGADGATPVAADATIGVMLKAFYDKTVGVEPIIHLGFGLADDLGAKLNSDGRFNAFPDVPVVINAGYPVQGAAITGPIEGWMGSVEQTQVHNVKINREYTEATALAALSFDPCAVVVRGLLPDQIHVGRVDKDSFQAFSQGSSTTTNIDWGDGGVWNVTTKEITTNVAKLTTSAAHKVAVGNTITVAGVDATFNGTYTVTAVTATTISYAKVNANVASTAATGTVTKAATTSTIAPGSNTGVTQNYAYPGTYTITVTSESGTTTYTVTTT